MKTIKRIIAAVDFSAYSPEVMECAATVAEALGAELIVANVISNQLIISAEKIFNTESPGRFSLEKFLHGEIQRRTREASSLIEQWVPDSVAARVVIRWGVPYDELVKVGDNERAELLVMAPHGMSDRHHKYRLGTTVEKTFRHSRVSIMRTAGVPRQI